MSASTFSSTKAAQQVDASTTVFPMSFAQRRLWFLHEMAPGNPFYNIPLAIPLGAQVHAPALERALNEIIVRHESLRTTFDEIDDEPSQIVHSELKIPLLIRPLDGHDPANHQQQIAQIAQQEARAPFDLRTGPVVRATLVGASGGECVLLLTIHHIVADGWSVGILFRELATLYAAYTRGETAVLPKIPVQYADFTMWQRDRLVGDRLETLMAYWRNKLADLPMLAMPTDHRRPEALDYSGAHVALEVPASLAQGGRELAREEQATPFMTLMAAFVCLISRYSGQTDLVVGTPIANRNQADTEQIIGFFVNSLILRCDLGENPTFRDVLRMVKSDLLDAYAHQDLPFEQLVEDLRPDRDMGRNPLFQVTFQLVNAPSLEAAATNPATAPQVQRGSAIFDLAFTLMDATDGPLRGMIEYSTQLYDEATVTRLAVHYRTLLQSAIADPDQPVTSIAFVTSNEHQLLVSQTTPPIDPVHDVLTTVEQTVTHSPDALTVSTSHGAFSRQEVWQRGGELARELGRVGVGLGDRVAFLCDGGPTAMTVMLAALRLGAAYVPLDPSHPRERLELVLNDAMPGCVVVSESLSGSLPESFSGEVFVDGSIPTHVLDDAGPARTPLARAPAYQLYTSGSTGQPKGIEVGRGALANHMAWMLDTFPLTSDDCVLQRTSVGFDASVWEFWAPLMSGARAVLLSPAEKRDSSEIAAAVRQHDVTILQVVPSLLEALLQEPDFITSESLRLVFCGGEALSSDLARRFAATIDASLINLYGPTEATIDATWHRCDNRDAGPAVPIGRPIAGTGALVLDDLGQPTPIGVPGKLFLTGDGLANGYFNQPALTAERFVPNPFAGPGERMYDTCDITRFCTSGDLEFLGRSDHQIKLRGHRIELGDIEHALTKCSEVSSAVVMLHAEQLIAFVVPDEQASGAGSVISATDTAAIERWEDLYSSIYAELSSDESYELNTVGWDSSYSGERIDEDAMRAWRDLTVERIGALSPSRVLEIGCGTGLIMGRVAPGIDRYVGTDLSKPALQYLEGELEQVEGLPPIELLHRPAHDLSGLQTHDFDLVILNSVSQYFPSARYLEAVLLAATKCLAPDGKIFIGDVRSFPLLVPFRTSVALHDADSQTSARELRDLVETAVDQEEELALAPAFFTEFAGRNELSCTEIALKRLEHETEMDLFRFDVVLAKASPRPSTSDVSLDWHRVDISHGAAPAISKLLAEFEGDCLTINGVPDGDMAGLQAVHDACVEPNRVVTARELRQLAQTRRHAVIGTAELRQVGEQQNFELLVRPVLNDDLAIDAVFLRNGAQAPVITALADRATALSNEPEHGALAARLIPELRQRLLRSLPDYMVPARYVFLDALPLRVNGKVDRSKLVLPTRRVVARVTPYVAPVTALQEELATVWADVFGVDIVGIHDDFFVDLGGHSLLAARLAARLRSALDYDISLQQIFDTPTVEQMADAIDVQEGFAPPDRGLLA